MLFVRWIHVFALFHFPVSIDEVAWLDSISYHVDELFMITRSYFPIHVSMPVSFLVLVFPVQLIFLTSCGHHNDLTEH